MESQLTGGTFTLSNIGEIRAMYFMLISCMYVYMYAHMYVCIYVLYVCMCIVVHSLCL